MIRDTHTRRDYLRYIWRRLARSLESLWNTSSERQTQIILFGSDEEQPLSYDELMNIVGVEVVSRLYDGMVELFPDRSSILRRSFIERRATLEKLAEAVHVAYVNERIMRRLPMNAVFREFDSLPDSFRRAYRLFVTEALERYEHLLDTSENPGIHMYR